MKTFLLFDFGTSIRPKNWIPFQELSCINQHSLIQNFIQTHKENLIRYFKIKNKKKRAKLSSRYSKKQVQALRVSEKISTLTFPVEYFAEH
jgi:hypothetical protein